MILKCLIVKKAIILKKIFLIKFENSKELYHKQRGLL